MNCLVGCDARCPCPSDAALLHERLSTCCTQQAPEGAEEASPISFLILHGSGGSCVPSTRRCGSRARRSSRPPSTSNGRSRAPNRACACPSGKAATTASSPGSPRVSSRPSHSCSARATSSSASSRPCRRWSAVSSSSARRRCSTGSGAGAGTCSSSSASRPSSGSSSASSRSSPTQEWRSSSSSSSLLPPRRSPCSSTPSG